MSITQSLSQEQLETFERDGFLAIEALTEPEEVAWLRQVYDRIFQEQSGRNEGNQFDLAGTDEDDQNATLPQILNPTKYAPELLESKLLINAERLGKQILGSEAVTRFAHAIYKPPHSGAATPWHQDGAYANPNKIFKHVNFWIPLQETTVENGTMQFVAGSNHMDVLRHQHINNDPRIHGLELHPDERSHLSQATPCPLPAGGATLHTKYTLHYAGPNRSEIPRRALIIGADAPPEDRPGHRTFPWQEETRTARLQRVEAAKSA